MNFVEISGENINEIEAIEILETECFGEGGVDIWVLRPFAKYGKIYCLKEGSKINAFCEILMGWDRKSVYIFSFGVAENSRGRGVGEWFLKEVLSRLKTENVEKVELTVNPMNKAGVKLYKKCGFIVEKEMENEYGNGESRYLMWKYV